MPECLACRHGRQHTTNQHVMCIETSRYLTPKFNHARYERDLILAHVALLQIDIAASNAESSRVAFHLAQFDSALERAFGRPE
jgi:hypothetical protein